MTRQEVVKEKRRGEETRRRGTGYGHVDDVLELGLQLTYGSACVTGSVSVCVRWDLLWAEDKLLKERKERLKKPGGPNSIVRYPNCFHHLFNFIIISGLNVSFSSSLSLSLFFILSISN